MAIKMIKRNMKSSYVYCFDKKKYCFDLNKLKEICFCYTNANDKNIESEITDVNNIDEDGNEMIVTQKVVRETKTNKMQNDVLMHDIVKTLMVTLLDNPGVAENIMDFPTGIAFNTLIEWGILKEIE